jgi:hypothetical protein
MKSFANIMLASMVKQDLSRIFAFLFRPNLYNL